MEIDQNKLIQKIIDIGTVKQQICEILDLAHLNNLSKHNPYFQSPYENEDERLEDLRCTLIMIKSILEDTLETINREV